MKLLTVILTFSSLWSFCYSLSITCLHNKDGRHYSGNVSTSESGKKCQPWILAQDKYSLNQLKVKSYEDAYCRNPNRSESTWCYISKYQTERCDIPVCLANPNANYCIPIPRIHYKACPLLFFESSHFKNYGSNQIVFCCLLKRLDISKLLPKDACLIVIVQTNAISDSFTTCPEGFYSKPMIEDVVESNIIYKCCQSQNTTDELEEKIKSYQSTNDGNDNLAPIMAHVSQHSGLCSPVQDMPVHTVEYHHMDLSSNHILPRIMTVCYYCSSMRPRIGLSHSKLGFMTLKECPNNFHQSNASSLIVVYGSVEMGFCWPNDPSYVYSIGNVCLAVKSPANRLYNCPDDFQTYNTLSALYIDPSPRFCCKVQREGPDYTPAAIVVTNRTSLSFIIPSGGCATYNFSTPITGVLRTALIRSTISHQVAGSQVLELPTCTYEPHREFAYKKIGHGCPRGMSSSSAIVNCSLGPIGRCQMGYCIGNVSSLDRPLPPGKYCLYKVSRLCPIGFQEPDISILDSTSLCCRNDEYNITQSAKYFPFVDINSTSSFGLVLLDNYDVCPTISDFISHIDFDIRGTMYCAYRSQEEDYIWRNEVIWPQSHKFPNKNSTMISATVDQYWRHLSQIQYRSSVIHKYPPGKYCVLSPSPCKSINPYTLIMRYPIKGSYICCELHHNQLASQSSSSWITRGKYLIGYLAIRGKCPSVEYNPVIVHDRFEIEKSRFDSSYGINLIEIGVVPDLHSRPSFINIDFQFCIFEINDEEKFKDQSNSSVFIKPTYSVCPTGFNEIMRNISIDIDDEPDPLSRHFVTKSLLYLCTPRQIVPTDRIFPWPAPLCGIALTNCSPDATINTQGTNIHQTLHLCCSKTKILHQATSDNLSTFSIPLHPDQDYCPRIRNLSSLKWKLSIPEIQGRQRMNLCFYYEPTDSSGWPLGDYLTIAYDRQCPSDFVLIDYHGTELCLRNNKRPSKSPLFPDGNYCILTYPNTSCPSSVSWHSKVDLIGLGQTVLNICCSITSSVVLNIPRPPDTVFSFLSMEKCSFVPGTVITERKVLNFRRIIQCIYVITECDERRHLGCVNKDNRMEKRSNHEVFLITRQNIILVLLVSILSILIIIGVIVMIFIICHRRTVASLQSSKSGDIKLSAMYTTIDLISNSGDTEMLDEDTPSVVYSII